MQDRVEMSIRAETAAVCRLTAPARRLVVTSLILALLAIAAAVFGQQTTGTPGSPNATTTIDGQLSHRIPIMIR